MDQNNGTRGQDFQRRNQNFLTIGLGEHLYCLPEFLSRPNSAYGNNNPNIGRSYDQRQNQSFNRNDGNRSRNGLFNKPNGNWRNNGNFSRSPSIQRRDYSQNSSNGQSRSDWPNNSAFRRSDNRPTTSFTSYEQNFPQNNNRTASNVVRFTTTDDTIIEISDLCPLNY